MASMKERVVSVFVVLFISEDANPFCRRWYMYEDGVDYARYTLQMRTEKYGMNPKKLLVPFI